MKSLSVALMCDL